MYRTALKSTHCNHEEGCAHVSSGGPRSRLGPRLLGPSSPALPCRTTKAKAGHQPQAHNVQGRAGAGRRAWRRARAYRWRWAAFKAAPARAHLTGGCGGKGLAAFQSRAPSTIRAAAFFPCDLTGSAMLLNTCVRLYWVSTRFSML